jgi:hypothetical protein
MHVKKTMLPTVWTENKIQYYMRIQLAAITIILKMTQQICKKKC